MSSIIERIKKVFFPSEDDKAWKEWVNFKDRDEKDLVDLISSDVRIEFKRRAIFLLIVPSAKFNVVYWKEKVGKFYYKPDFLVLLSAEELDYAADLIFDFCSELRPVHIEKSKVAVSSGGGVTIYAPVMNEYHDALYFYNNCIIELLPLLPEKKASKIFSYFSLLDISTYFNMERFSGYWPFAILMSSNRIHEKWKRLADMRMRDIIENEICGKTKPREDWERAFPQYVSIFQDMLESCRYSRELYARQLKFIMERLDQNPKIDAWKVIRVFECLPGSDYKDLRYLFAKYVLFGANGKDPCFSSIYNQETEDAANFMLKEFYFDYDMVQMIKVLQSKKETRELEEKIAAEKRTNNEDDILSKMK